MRASFSSAKTVAVAQDKKIARNKLSNIIVLLFIIASSFLFFNTCLNLYYRMCLLFSGIVSQKLSSASLKIVRYVIGSALHVAEKYLDI